jgi:hypothetical protein
MAENALTISLKAVLGAAKARSTRLYAIAASTVGSAEDKRCNSMEIVSFVTCRIGF